MNDTMMSLRSLVEKAPDSLMVGTALILDGVAWPTLSISQE